MAETIQRPRGFHAVPRRDSNATRRKVGTLERRLRHLEARVEEHRNPFDLDEIRSLRWALAVVREWMAADPLFEVYWSGAFVDNASLQDLVDLLGTEVHFEGERAEIVSIRFADQHPQPTVWLAGTVAQVTLRPLTNGEQASCEMRVWPRSLGKPWVGEQWRVSPPESEKDDGYTS